MASIQSHCFLGCLILERCLKLEKIRYMQVGKEEYVEKDSANASAEPKLLGRRCIGSADSQNCSFVRSLLEIDREA